MEAGPILFSSLIIFSLVPIKLQRLRRRQTNDSPTIDAPEQTALLTKSRTTVSTRPSTKVFALMLGTPVTVSDSAVGPHQHPHHAHSSEGLAGAISGGYTVVVNEATAKQIAAPCSASKSTEMDGDVYDASRRTHQPSCRSLE